jgi:transcriptional regulator with XRE-family HTH domain
VQAQIDTRFFAERIRDVVRDEPKAFAYDLGLSLSAVYNYLNGRVPATEVLFRIAQYTGRPMEWFLVEDGPAVVSAPAGTGEPAVVTASAARGGGEGT